LLSLMALLLAVGLSCALGPFAARGPQSAEPTPTKTLRPTFTPIGGVGAVQSGGNGGPLGPQPPGVTVQAPGAATSESSPGNASGGGEGSTNLVLVATETPPPTATVIPRTPFVIPSVTVDVETNRPTRESGVRAAPTPYVVVEADRLNGRRGPGESYERVGQAAKGDELMIMARTADGLWWQVCCLANQPAWVPAAQVSARGAVEKVAAVEPGPPPPPTQRPAPRPRPQPTATPLPGPTPLPPFDVARGPEFPLQRDNGLMTIWVRVYEGEEPYTKSLPGYVLRVLRNSEEVSLPVPSSELTDSTGPQQGNYEYNLKFEMVDAGEADWQIYLATADGNRVSPVTKFTTMGDSYRNLVAYVAYLRAR
jgi:uncharacterized protein YgiM (DUF1202 family)